MTESWIQILTLFFANAALIAWFRAESRQDWRLMDSKMESFRAETGQILRSIQEEIKDFHGKLERQDAEFKAHLMSHEQKLK
jgi:hypothetical protein